MNEVIRNLGHFFYIFNNPSEGVFEEIAQQELYLAGLVAIEIFYYLSVKFLVPKSYWKSFGIQVKWSLGTWVVNMGSIALERSVLPYLLYIYIPHVSAYNFGEWIWENYRIIDLDPFSWSSWIICIITVDFVFYAAHRLTHEVAFLWAFHQVHHSSEEYSYASSTRRPILSSSFTETLLFPLFFFFHPRILFFHWQVNGTMYQFWLHTDFIPKLWWPIEFIFNTPSQHRVHHGVNPYAIDKNYAGFLSIWDRMFGTFAEERDWEEEKLQYGLINGHQTFDVLTIQLAGITKLLKRAMNAKGLDKIRTLVYGPGWVPGSARLGPEIPDPAPKLEKYSKFETYFHWHFGWYVIIQSLCGFCGVLYSFLTQNDGDLILGLSISLFAYQCCGLMLTYPQSTWPIQMEFLRVVCTMLRLRSVVHLEGLDQAIISVYILSSIYLIWCLSWDDSINRQGLISKTK